MPQIQANGVTLYYHDQGRGTPLVLLHAFPFDSRIWSDQLADLTSRFRVITVDFRGFGRSSSNGPFTIDQLADDIHAFARQLNLEPFVLAGISMGGYVALAYVNKYAQSLRGLILIDTRADGESEEGKHNRDRMIEIANTRGAKPIAQAMINRLISPESAASKPELASELVELMEQVNPQTMAHALAAMRDRADQIDSLPNIKIQTLLIVGERDAITPPQFSEGMKSVIPHASIVVITGAGHLSPIEQPALFNQAVQSFIDSL